MPYVMVLGDGSSGSYIGHKVSSFMNVMSPDTRDPRKLPHPFYHTRTQGEDSHL